MIGNYNDERRFLSHLARLRYEEGKLDKIILPSIKKQIKTNSLQIMPGNGPKTTSNNGINHGTTTDHIGISNRLSQDDTDRAMGIKHRWISLVIATRRQSKA